MAHTPGPWRHDREGARIVSKTAFNDYSTPEDPKPVSIISLFGAMGGDDSAADAALIASAPAMLAALAKLHDAADDYCEHAKERHFAALQVAMGEAADLIAAATGAATGETVFERTFTAFCQESDGTGTIWIDEVRAANVESAIEQARKACAEAWGYEPAAVHCLGLIEGAANVAHWEDVGES